MSNGPTKKLPSRQEGKRQVFCQQRIQCEQNTSRSRKQARSIGGVHPPEGSEDVVVQLEFQAKAHQAGRAAKQTGPLRPNPATQERQAPQQKGPKQRHGANGSPSALVLLPALATRSLGHVRRSASDDAPVAKYIQQGNVVKPCCDLHLTMEKFSNWK